MNTCKGIIVSGGRIDYDFAVSFIEKMARENDGQELYLIAADAGVLFFQKAGMKPKLIVGDFDSSGKDCLSVYEGDPEVEIRTFRPEKDWTDTEIAVSAAAQLGLEKVWLLGGTGTRLDHVLGNMQVLAMAADKGLEVIMVDRNNRISTPLKKQFTLKKEDIFGHYISFFALGGDVEGLTLEGFAYDTQDLTLTAVGSLAVSNEVKEEVASVTYRRGRLLMIESVD